jgi:hypothetical protein
MKCQRPDQKSQVVGETFEYFPLWYFKRAAGRQGRDRLDPGAATSVTEIRNLNLPAGDLRKYEDLERRIGNA